MEAPKLGTIDFWDQLIKNPAKLAREVCTIDVISLDKTLQEHPALRAWINASFEAARIEEEKGKWDVTKTRAMVLYAASRENDEKTGKTKTLAVLEAEVDCNPKVQAAVEKLHHLQEVRGSLKAMADALSDRKDMLVQIAAKQRREMDDYR